MAVRNIQPLVRVIEGQLRGRVSTSTRGGISYCSFQGIPYAEPPVGPLRFKPPRPVKPWVGIRDALEEGPQAPQFMLSVNNEFLESSSEDCLYLNVYTPELPKNNDEKRPVLVWIHGGGFVQGSGNTDIYGPDYLIGNGVVLVSINYRLGALGFLSLQCELCPGNNGLKDQAEALRWVKRNIAAFGGDPNNVTIFGESAGGASVQFHTLSSKSKGLFHRAISQSGSVLNPWATSKHPVEIARALAENCGLKTEDNAELLEFLMTLPAKTIVEKSDVVKKVEPWNYYLGIAFAPVVEVDGPDAFLTQPVEDLVRNGQIHDVPYILGINTLEGGIVVNPRKGLPPFKTDQEWERLLPPHPKLRVEPHLSKPILDKIKNFYFANGYNEDKVLDVLSSIYFLAGNDEVLHALSQAKNRKSNTYFYVFTHDTELSMLKPMWGFADKKGTFHADDLDFLFYHNLFPLPIESGSSDDKMIDVFTKLWADFAATGNPTPVSKLWPAYSEPEKPYLEIKADPEVGQDVKAEELKFWREIFDEVRGAVSPKL